jgi:hypothetical protein
MTLTAMPIGCRCALHSTGYTKPLNRAHNVDFYDFGLAIWHAVNSRLQIIRANANHLLAKGGDSPSSDTQQNLEHQVNLANWSTVFTMPDRPMSTESINPVN